MAVRMRGKPYDGDAYQEIRNAGFWGFWKLGREIVGPDGELIYPERCNRLDYEGEIAIVLGKRGADLKVSQLKDYVWGVTMLADWSIRAPRETPGGPLNFNFPKNFDTSCSMGPCIAVGEVDPMAKGKCARATTWAELSSVAQQPVRLEEARRAYLDADRRCPNLPDLD
jgi:2-keto-4-pentenoate hydratase/2-oxohepta-3-ene-1,7-dioic acid hydratase in catechol pathway